METIKPEVFRAALAINRGEKLEVKAKSLNAPASTYLQPDKPKNRGCISRRQSGSAFGEGCACRPIHGRQAGRKVVAHLAARKKLDTRVARADFPSGGAHASERAAFGV